MDELSFAEARERGKNRDPSAEIDAELVAEFEKTKPDLDAGIRKRKEDLTRGIDSPTFDLYSVHLLVKEKKVHEMVTGYLLEKGVRVIKFGWAAVTCEEI